MDEDGDGLSAFMEYALGSSDSLRGDSTIQTGVEEFQVDGVTDRYLTVRFRRNLHSLNSVRIEAEVAEDLVSWYGEPHVVLVSETDNMDGTSTVVYRSALPVGGTESGKDFIRLRVEQ